jgi:hypothetical protein
VTANLLDANLLIALAWPQHVHQVQDHRQATDAYLLVPPN